MGTEAEAERIRLECEEAESDALREDPAGAAGEAARVGQTAAQASYPTAAAVVYYLKALDILGSEAEGAAGAISDSGARFYALNLGSSIPPLGTNVVCTKPGHRWVFRYD